MLRESFKWMLVTLFAAAILIAAVLGLIKYIQIQGRVEADVVPSPIAEVAVPNDSVQPFLPTPAATPDPTPTPMPKNTNEKIRQYIAGMSTEQKLGQMVLFGFAGTSSPSDTFIEILHTYQIGNIILYGNNIKSGNNDGGFTQCSKLIDAAKSEIVTQVPPLVAIDIEGGNVTRFTWSNWPASARTLGRRRDRAYAEEQFAVIGQKLMETGINLNLAPVLDVSEDPMSTFLETRIISEDAEITSAIGAAVIDGLHSAGCLSTAKHFPGHGGTTQDSHDVTPVVQKSIEDMDNYDLKPFAAAVDAGVDAILVAHILYPSLDENEIASMSPVIITDLLRDQLGFTGVVMSDDFRMGGLTTRYDISDAAVRFVLAGGDMIMCGAQHDKQIAIMDGLLAAAGDGRLTGERIDESVFRILKKKLVAANFQAELQ
ncbi:MAG: glycoside hydrolase family 3 N-terminal domain-containing protein [Clostridia bacterium]